MHGDTTLVETSRVNQRWSHTVVPV